MKPQRNLPNIKFKLRNLFPVFGFKTVLFFFIVFATFSIFQACKKPAKPGKSDNFDKGQLLSQIANNLILPAYSNYTQHCDSMLRATQLFESAKDSVSLRNLQYHILQAWNAYQRVSVYEIGPAESVLLRANANTFPCDTAQILLKIAAADYDLSAADVIDAKGYPALDYLLFEGYGGWQSLWKRYSTNPDAANTVKYIKAIVAELQKHADQTHQAWLESGGNYSKTFREALGSNIGSSVGMLVNQICFDLEILKNAKIGIPAGKRSMGTQFPDKTEAYYSKTSKKLALTQLSNIENLYLGNSSKGDSMGFDEYLIYLDAKYNQGTLSDAIRNQFVKAQTALGALPDNVAASLNLAPEKVDTAYTELQKLVILLKVDMTSVLGVQITYQDNDGD